MLSGYSTVTFITLDPPTDPNARGHFNEVLVHFSR